VINFNGHVKLGELFDKFMTTLLSTRYENLEILFLDNNSSDDSVEYVKKKYKDPRLRVIELSRNYGYAGAANIGVKIARGDIIGVLNNDLVFGDSMWLAKLVDAFLLAPRDVAIISPLLMYNDEYIDSAGGKANILVVGWDWLSRHKINELPYRDKYYVLSPPGALFLFKRELLKYLRKGNIFETDYFAYYEDTNLGFKTNLMGFKVMIYPQVKIFHKRGGYWGFASPKKFYYLRRNGILTGVSTFGLRAVLSLLVIWLLSTIYAARVYILLCGENGYMREAFRAIRGVLKDFSKHLAIGKFYRSRSKIKPNQLPLENILVLDTSRPNTLQKIFIETVNLFAWIAGLKKFKINKVEFYPLFGIAKKSNKKKKA